MAYTPNDIYDYIIENDRESEFLQAITLHKQNFSIGEITDRRFLVKEDKTVKFISKMYKINIQITDDDIITAVMNGLYVSAFISRQGDAYNVHFLVHAYPENMKSQFDDEILKEVLRYMITGGRPRPWRQRLARLLARDATDALPGAGGGHAAGVYPRYRGVWRTGGAGQPGGSGDADGRY